MLTEGTQSPAFTLPDASGKPVSLSDCRGKIAVLYFYSRTAPGAAPGRRRRSGTRTAGF